MSISDWSSDVGSSDLGNLLHDGGFQKVWQDSALFNELRSPQTGGACSSCQFFDSCRGGCMAAKFFPGLALDGDRKSVVQGQRVSVRVDLGRCRIFKQKQ